MTNAGPSAAREFLDRLAGKWHEVPLAGLDRASTRALGEIPDGELLDLWERVRADTSDGLRGLNLRGWFYLVYGPWLAGKKILEVGPGLGTDGVAVAERGCDMTLVDVSRTNLDIVTRIFALKSLPAPRVLHLEDFDALDALATDYDAVLAFGSLHHIPADVGRPEFQALARRIKPGGRFIMHAYPYQRWVDEGRLPFEQWGEQTDGAGTPWAEWYDSRKLIAQLRPLQFAPVLYCEYRDGAMNCIDVVRIDGDAQLQPAPVPVGAEPVPDAIALGALAVQPDWAAEMTTADDGSVMITTPPEPWAYAAAAPITDDGRAARGGRYLVRVSATVQEGRIGIGVLAADGRTFLAEQYLGADDWPQACLLDIVIPADGVHGPLMVRNASPRAGRSRAIVHAVNVFLQRERA